MFSKKSSIRNRLLIISLINALIIIIGIFSVNHFLDIQNDDAVLVNLAGRQRMLTQRMTKSSLSLEEFDQNSEEFNSFLDILKESNDLYSSTLEMFIRGGETKLGIDYISVSPVVKHRLILLKLEQTWLEFKYYIEQIINLSDDISDNELYSKLTENEIFIEAIQFIILNNETLLWETDHIVTLLQEDAEIHLLIIKIVIFMLLIIEIVIILFMVKLLHEGLLKPFNRLFNAIETIGNGLKYHPVIEEKYQEWSITEEHIETMYKNLSHVQEELFTLNKDLEKKVVSRTQDLRNTIEQLEITYQELILKEKQATLGTLVAGVAHEVNTPLGACITSSSKLSDENDELIKKLEDGELTKKDFLEYIHLSSEIIEIIEFNLKRAANIIRSFKKIAVYESTGNEDYFYLDEYLNDIWISLSHIAKKYECKFINEVEHEEIYGEPGDYSQIFGNLIMNTFLHGYNQGDKVKIQIFSKIDKSDMKLHYKDFGKGISDNNIGKIFDPFFTTNRQKGGSGLGLNVVRCLSTMLS